MTRFERTDEGGEGMGKDNDLLEEEKDSRDDIEPHTGGQTCKITI